MFHEDEHFPWRERKPLFYKILKSDSWVTGGRCGGSCWDDGEEDHHRPRSSDTEEPFTSLDNLLLKFCPNLSFIHYKKISEKLIQRYQHSDNEYYGNYTDYEFKYIQVKDLYNYLKDNNLFE